MKKIFTELTEELVEATKQRDEMDVEYEYEKARLLFSAEINALANQTMRDSQLTLKLHELGWDRKIAEVRTRARIAYYKWASVKSLIDRKGYDND